MTSFADFEEEVQTALFNLNDPTHPPGPIVARVLRVNRADELRAILTATIESLRPDSKSPPDTRGHRLYELLHCRFVREMPQRVCAQQLGLSSRHLRREQQIAIHLIAERLWPQGTNAEVEPSLRVDTLAPSWRSQLQQEFSAIQQYADVSNLAQIIQGAVALHNMLGVHPHVQVHIGDVDKNATITIHHAVLEQIMFVAIDSVASNGTAREIVVSSTSQRLWTRITIRSRPASSESLPTGDFMVEAMVAHGGRVEIAYAAGWVTLELLLPTTKKVSVLVVDDNLDLVHFYKRYVEGTEYELVHISQGNDVWDAIERSVPSCIVLDLMLPDINGWHLLHELLQRPTTAHIPIIVCSVVNQETLATTLGAAAYLPKPVHRQAFIQTLDRIRQNH